MIKMKLDDIGGQELLPGGERGMLRSGASTGIWLVPHPDESAKSPLPPRGGEKKNWTDS